jgi:DnaJ-class molecular chaperone
MEEAQMIRIEPCPDCSGEGIIPAGEIWYSCAECKGTGKITIEEMPPEAHQATTDDIDKCPYEEK